MEYKGSLDPFLDSTVDWSKINTISFDIFKYGNFDKIDELLVLILPLINITYYKHARWLDDRNYAKEDLIQDAILEIYKDIKFRWDKYINIDNYPKYFETVARNVMINLVHAHHNYYKTAEFSPDLNYDLNSTQESFGFAEVRILKEEFDNNLLETTRRLANCRKKHSKILNKLITEIYINKNIDALNIKSKLRVLGIDRVQFDLLYEHVFYLHRLSYNYHMSIMKGNEKMRIRIEEVIRRYESPTYEVLARNYSDSIIPELFAELGPDLTKKVVRVFSGRTMKVPDYRDFCDDLLGGTIYSLAGGDKSNLYKIASDNNLPYRALSRIYDKVAKYKEGGAPK